MSTSVVANTIAFGVQVAFIVGAAALILRVLPIASAGTRYFCWRLVLVASLAMPLLLHQTVPMADDASLVVSDAIVFSSSPMPSEAPVPVPAPVDGGVPWFVIAAAVIAFGVAARAAWLGVGLARLRALRRGGVPVTDVLYDEIQGLLNTRARIMSVEGLRQPATFGLWRPVVLLPESLADASGSIRRAVVTHELFHVQRRDWFWVIAEELLRTLLWFHPAIVWVTSRIQLVREELVDELTVLATGNRKAYIEALLAFADAGRVRPAPAFVRRRQLFSRIVRLSRESAMSSSRIIVSAGLVIAAVLSAGWSASAAFPIVTAAPTGPGIRAASAEQAPEPARHPRVWNEHVRDTQEGLRVLAAQTARSGGAPRPGPAAAGQATAAKPITPENPIPRRLSSVAVPYPAQLRGSGLRASVAARVTLDASGRIADVQRVAADIFAAAPGLDRDTAATAFFEATAGAVSQWRYQPPADPPIAFFVTVRFDGEQDSVAAQSEAPVALARFVALGNPLRSDLALFEEQLQRLRAAHSAAATQAGAQDARVSELDRTIQEMERELERTRDGYTAALRADQPVPAVAAPAGVRVAGPGAIAGQPLRVGGNVRPPTKTRHVAPLYPEIAKSARVQGVVIMETVIDEQGRVAEARVLRSIPLLDQAALDAVRLWEFTPTLLNGQPVPVIMTVTVQFTLPEQPAQ